MSSIWACVIPREDSLHLDIIYEGSEGEPRLGHEDLYPGEDVWGIPYDTWLAHAGEERVDVTELARSLLAEGWPDLSL